MRQVMRLVMSSELWRVIAQGSSRCLSKERDTSEANLQYKRQASPCGAVSSDLAGAMR